jgi:hypothetical protein
MIPPSLLPHPSRSDVPSHETCVSLFEKYDKNGDSIMDFDEYHDICRVSTSNS